MEDKVVKFTCENVEDNDRIRLWSVDARITSGLVRTTCLLKARWSLLPTSTLGMPGACSSTSFTHLQKKGHLATLGAANESAEWVTGLMIRIKRRPVHALEAPLVGYVVDQ